MPIQTRGGNVDQSTTHIWQFLDQVPDPEIPAISIVDLGIVRDVSWKDELLRVTITPTYSGCPATSVIGFEIEKAALSHGIENIEIKQQISPAWTTDWITERGKNRLKSYGIAPPNPAGGPDCCPKCGAVTVERISQFGSTPCKAQWRCQSCLEPFDYFKCL